jgi:sugar phosphate permease
MPPVRPAASAAPSPASAVGDDALGDDALGDDALGDDALGRATIRRVTLRLLPFLFLCYLLNFLDRTNVGIAALQMNRDLRFSDAAYGLGAGIFFLGYALCEVPSNVMLARVGARRWIGRIMVSWGLVATAMLFVRTPTQFVVARFLLGVAEAGFFPGIVYYLGQWFPAAERARALSRFMIAIPLSNAVGAPVSAALLGLDGTLGLAGWQWLFLVEGVPSVLVGLAVFRLLADRPAGARWLPGRERAWLEARLAHEEAASPLASRHTSALAALRQPLVWLLALPYFLLNTTAYVYTFWAPTLFRDALGLTPSQVGLLSAVVTCAIAVVMLAVGASADRRGAHALHVAAGAAISAAGLAAVALAPSNGVLLVAGFTLLLVGTTGVLPAFWFLPGALLRGTGAAAAIALVNAIGALGGFVGPWIMGALRDATGSAQAGFAAMCGGAVGMCASALLLHRRLANAARSVVVPLAEKAAT